jgi:uncharacterized protein
MLFVDTSALYAVVIRDDRHHADAARVEREIRSRREQLWTIDPVLTELWLLMRREVAASRSDAVVAGLLGGGLRRELLEEQDFARAWQIGRDWSDQNFSLTDRQAFAVLERTRRFSAWSYDHDFSVIRLGPARDRLLDLVQ